MVRMESRCCNRRRPAILQEARVWLHAVEKRPVDVEHVDIVPFGSPVPKSHALVDTTRTSTLHYLRSKYRRVLMHTQCPQRILGCLDCQCWPVHTKIPQLDLAIPAAADELP